MKKDDLQPLILDILREGPKTGSMSIDTGLRKRATERGLEYGLKDEPMVCEIIWDLVRQGVVVLGNGLRDPIFDVIRVTEHGKNRLDEGAP